MKRKLVNKVFDIEDIAVQAEKGIDVSKFFTGKTEAKQRVNVDYPLELLRSIDAECRRLGVTRQAWIKIACDEKIRQTRPLRIRAAK